jgi:hypothetical protein
MIYTVTFVPLFWPLELVRLIPYSIMFYLLSRSLNKTTVNKAIVYTIFILGVFFDVAPIFSTVPLITTVAMIICASLATFSSENVTFQEQIN